MKANLLIAAFLISCTLFAQLPQMQTISTPMESQKAMVMQRIGITDITIEFSRPAVKERKIWGELVHFNNGKPYPWRAGANENTTIQFTHPVKIEGQDLPAGKYGFHVIPGKEECILIFSSNHTSWGSFYYRQSEDVVRVNVKPSESPFQEFLAYQFESMTDSSAVISIRWENFQIPFKILVDTKKNMVDYIRNSFRTPLAFTWQGYNSAAEYCNYKNYNLTEALTWAERSIQTEETFFNTKTKSEILGKLGKKSKADSTWVRALEVGSIADLNRGYNIYSSQKDYDKAKQVAQTMEKRYPTNWRGHYNLAQLYKTSNEKELATKSLNKALKLATDASIKKRIEDQLKSLK